MEEHPGRWRTEERYLKWKELKKQRRKRDRIAEGERATLLRRNAEEITRRRNEANLSVREQLSELDMSDEELEYQRLVNANPYADPEWVAELHRETRKKRQDRNYQLDMMDDYERFIELNKDKYGSVERATEVYLKDAPKWLKAIAKSNPKIAKQLPMIVKTMGRVNGIPIVGRAMTGLMTNPWAAAFLAAGLISRAQHEASYTEGRRQTFYDVLMEPSLGAKHAYLSTGMKYDDALARYGKMFGMLEAMQLGFGPGIEMMENPLVAMSGIDVKGMIGLTPEEAMKYLGEQLAKVDPSLRSRFMMGSGYDYMDVGAYISMAGEAKKHPSTSYDKWRSLIEAEYNRKASGEDGLWGTIVGTAYNIPILGDFAKYLEAKYNVLLEDLQGSGTAGKVTANMLTNGPSAFDFITNPVRAAYMAARSAFSFESTEAASGASNGEGGKSITISMNIGTIESSASNFEEFVAELTERASKVVNSRTSVADELDGMVVV